MYISHYFFDELENTENGLVDMDNSRIQYYSDLCKRYQSPIGITKTKIYAYEYISNILFNVLQDRNLLEDAAWILFPKHGYSWDGAHVAPELYLKNKYSLKNKLLDVRDCGTLCAYQALSLAISLNKNTMIASIESDIVLNSFPYIAYLKIMTKQCEGNSLSIIDCDLFFIKNKNDLKNKINFILVKHNINNKDASCYFHADHMYCFDSGFLYKAVSFIFKNKLDIPYFLIVDQEITSLRAAIVLLKWSRV